MMMCSDCSRTNPSHDAHFHGLGSNLPGTEQCLLSFKRTTFYLEISTVSQEFAKPESTEVPCRFPIYTVTGSLCNMAMACSVQTPCLALRRWSHGQVPAATTSRTHVCSEGSLRLVFCAPPACPPTSPPRLCSPTRGCCHVKNVI